MMNYQNVYTDAFSQPTYSIYDENEFKLGYVHKFIENNKQIETIIDVGSGRGLFLKIVNRDFPNIKLTSVDLKKFHDLDVEFIQLDLSSEEDRHKLGNRKYDLLTCFDVLEHLEKSFIDDVLHLISRISNTSLLTIANHSDIWNGVELHTIQEDFSYWKPLLEKYFNIVYYEESYVIDGIPRLYLVTVNSK